MGISCWNVPTRRIFQTGTGAHLRRFPCRSCVSGDCHTALRLAMTEGDDNCQRPNRCGVSRQPCHSEGRSPVGISWWNAAMCWVLRMGTQCPSSVLWSSVLRIRRLPEGELPRRGKRGHPGVRANALAMTVVVGVCFNGRFVTCNDMMFSASVRLFGGKLGFGCGQTCGQCGQLMLTSVDNAVVNCE